MKTAHGSFGAALEREELGQWGSNRTRECHQGRRLPKRLLPIHRSRKVNGHRQSDGSHQDFLEHITHRFLEVKVRLSRCPS